MADIITLKQLCAELKLAPREARELLLSVAHDPKKHPELAKTHKPVPRGAGLKDRLAKRKRGWFRSVG